MSIPVSGDFASIPGMSAHEAAMLADAYNAVRVTESWENFRNFSEQSFMFSGSTWLNAVQAEMKMMDGHSGSSYGWTMRVIEFIAKNGWETYVRDMIAARATQT
jgi:hypothetical protein